MDIRKVKKLIEMLEQSKISEIEIHEGEESVRISRVSSVTPAQTLVQLAAGASSMAVESGARPVPGAAVPAPRETREEPEGNVVKSPMVGIFYESPAPGKAPFVELGKTVAKGEVLCIIEAMKIMNQIESEFSGIISKIMVENGEPVEYGQPLFIIKEE
jgi:acetyl-CoA carboxylase biotin carboxyl carrier protein